MICVSVIVLVTSSLVYDFLSLLFEEEKPVKILLSNDQN